MNRLTIKVYPSSIEVSSQTKLFNAGMVLKFISYTSKSCPIVLIPAIKESVIIAIVKKNQLYSTLHLLSTEKIDIITETKIIKIYIIMYFFLELH